MRKIKICRIPNEGARKTTFFKRKQGITKKLHELSTLCGIQACGVINSPFQSEPEFWPSKSGAQEVVSRFLKMPTISQNQKMSNQATYLDDMITKTQKKSEKMAAECRDLELRVMMSGRFEGKMPEFGDGKNHLDLVSYIEKFYGRVNGRQLELRGESSSSCFPGGFAGASSIPTGGFMDLASSSGGFAGDSFTPTVGFLAPASGSGGFGDASTGGRPGGFGELGQGSGSFGSLDPSSRGGFYGAAGLGGGGFGVQSISGGFGGLGSQSSDGGFSGGFGGLGSQSISGGFGGLGSQSSDGGFSGGFGGLGSQSSDGGFGGGFGSQSSIGSFDGFGSQSNGGGFSAIGGNTGTIGNPSELFTEIGALDAAPSGLYDQNEQELVQYVAPNNLYDHNQHGSHAFMDGSNYYNIEQLPFADLAITSHMSSSNTGVYAPDADNNV